MIKKGLSAMNTHTLRNSFRVSVIAGLLAASAAPRLVGAADKPNVLLICCDDLNQSLGCYGNKQVQTPNIDALAERGMRFTRAYAQWPSCLPSRFSFLSGWSPVTTKVTDFSFTSRQGPLEQAVYLPQHFKGHGYLPRGWTRSSTSERTIRRRGRFPRSHTRIRRETSRPSGQASS